MERSEYLKIVSSWLKELSQVLGVELILDADGICTFKADEKRVIVIEVAQELPMVYIYTPLMNLPADNKDAALALAARALELNAFQVETRGGAIALVPGSGVLIFSYPVPIEGTHAAMFAHVLGEFYAMIPELSKLLDGSSPTPKAKANPVAEKIMMIKI